MFQVDAFADQAYSGNAAAVCLLNDSLSADLMQSIAAENNLSETAFLLPIAPGRYRIRWFAPAGEVDLCGHATLAAAHVVLKILQPELQQVEFFKDEQCLRVTKEAEQLALDFPAISLQQRSLQELPLELASPSIQAYYYGHETMVLELASEQDVASYQAPLSYLRAKGAFLSVTAVGRDCDFVSRFFAPSIGIEEDPVTGSAHCYLGPLWAERLAKTRLHAKQLSKRGGELKVELCEPSRVKIIGSSVCVMTADFYPQGF